MNFLEICKMVLDEADLYPDDLEDVRITPSMLEPHRNVIRFVQRAYRKVQRQRPFWPFHHNSGVFLETLADETQDYTVANVRMLLPDSFRCRVKTTTAEWPIQVLTYMDWRDQFSLGEVGTGNPHWLLELPDEDYRIVPKPTQVCEILGDWYSTLSELRTRDDEPVWHKDYHELLVWMALLDYSSEYEAGENLVKRVSQELPELRRAFAAKYTPELEGAGGFM